jgi:hypothetical protein
MLAACVQKFPLDLDDAPFEIVEPQVARSVHVGDVGRHLAHADIRMLLILIESLQQPGLRVMQAFGELLFGVLETYRELLSELLFRLANPRIDQLADLLDEFASELLEVCSRDRCVSIGFHTMLILPSLESLCQYLSR